MTRSLTPARPTTTMVRYAPDLLEEVVRGDLDRREARRDTESLRAYHAAADPLYRLPPPARTAAFTDLHARLFRDLGFAAPVRAALAGRPELAERLPSLTLLRALAPGEEAADLGAAEGDRRPAVLRVRPARFLGRAPLAPFLDHELEHLADILDPGFGHDPDGLATVAPTRRRAVQERYRVAWAVSVDGRLAHRGRPPLAEGPRRRQELCRAFAELDDHGLEAFFQRLWSGPRPAHPELLALAMARAGSVAGGPGTACPLCGFPTHRWAGAADRAVAVAVRRDAPGWEPADGLCERCLERYALGPGGPS